MENGWGEWSKYVLKELERLNSCYDGINTQLGRVREEIATLKVKASIWGALGGCLPILIILAIKFIERGGR